ncbi:hypothetical protein [Empedobacter brevis]|uniref:hypothetical protein n=1 Tax=Empedobacter brevis TaxID=247 RepID=UPI0039B09BC6
MKKLFTLIILCSTFSFGQYIKEATFRLKDGKSIDVRDVVYSEKVYQFTKSDNPYTLESIPIKYVTEIKFDSINYSKKVPDLKETFFENDLPEGIYETIDDFYKKEPTSTEAITGKEEGLNLYERPRDLMTFKFKSNDKIIKKPFAVVYRGELYFGIKGIDKHESKEMQGSFALMHSINRYVRVKYKTENYYYTDMPLKTAGSVIAGAAVGGAIGGAIMASAGGRNSFRPVVLINNEQKFYEVKNCKRFNEYFKTRLNLTFNCDNKDEHEYNIENVRKIMINN